ncbi:hypothetical protein BKA62DRAFT_349436 [Auriculariales sp. MPI-PUGE-AT-0066]|nr:hypothetical protein BKA62DRAFT_349436 [Auriculariales sp. MPI-PUGE-AT-0066]
MLTLDELPDDVITVILLDLDVSALRALSQTCTHLQHIVKNCRIAWLECVIRQSRALADRPTVAQRYSALSADTLRSRTFLSHRALHRIVSGSTATIFPEAYGDWEEAMDNTFLGRVVAFQQLDEEHVLVGENFISSCSLAVYNLDRLKNVCAQSGQVLHLNLECQTALKFASLATCIDLQPSRDGSAYEIIVDVEKFADHGRYMAHELYQLFCEEIVDEHGVARRTWAFKLLTAWNGLQEPCYTCISGDWIAWNFASESQGAELLFWNWRRHCNISLQHQPTQELTLNQDPAVFVRATVTDMFPDSSTAWAVHFTHPYVQVVNTATGHISLYSILSPTPVQPSDPSGPTGAQLLSNSDAPPPPPGQITFLRLSPLRAARLPKHWRRQMTLWQHGQASRIPPTDFGPSFGRVQQVWLHAGISRHNELVHCLLPLLDGPRQIDGGNLDDDHVSWPLVMSARLPAQIQQDHTRPARVIHTCSLADKLVTFIVSTLDRQLWVCVHSWEEVLAPRPVQDIVTSDYHGGTPDMTGGNAEVETDSYPSSASSSDSWTTDFTFAGDARDRSYNAPGQHGTDTVPTTRRHVAFHRLPIPEGTPQLFLEHDVVNWIGPWPVDIDPLTGTLMYFSDPYDRGLEAEPRSLLVALRLGEISSLSVKNESATNTTSQSVEGRVESPIKST